MERRNRSIKALERLQYIDSLDIEDKASSLVNWVKEYINDLSADNLDLEMDDLKRLSELFYKNINFLKQHQIDIKSQLDSHNKIKEFLR